MCEHCGCRQVEPIAELMDEHFALLELGGEVRRQLAEGRAEAALAALDRLGHMLQRHVRREEAGVFAALKAQGDFAATVAELEDEHVTFDEELADLDPAAADLPDRVERLLAELSDHIDKENLGVFPVAVVTLGADGWDAVARAEAMVS